MKNYTVNFNFLNMAIVFKYLFSRLTKLFSLKSIITDQFLPIISPPLFTIEMAYYLNPSLMAKVIYGLFFQGALLKDIISVNL
jgi:hypothetical protein